MIFDTMQSYRWTSRLVIFGALICVNMDGFPVAAVPVVSQDVGEKARPKLDRMGSPKVEFDKDCQKDDDCQSGSCFRHISLKPTDTGRCHCRACKKRGCGGCPATKNCEHFSEMVPNFCQTLLAPTEVPTESKTGSPSFVHSHGPTFPLTNGPTMRGPQCEENINCERDLVCDNSYGCKKKICFRNVDCTKYDAYCSQKEICIPKKGAGERCVDPQECSIGICNEEKCQFPSDSPTFSPTSSEIQPGDLLSLVNAKTKVAVSSGTSWFENQNSQTKLGVVGAGVATGLLLFSIFSWFITWAFGRKSQRPGLKRADSENGSRSSFYSRNNPPFCDRSIGRENSSVHSRPRSPVSFRENSPPRSDHSIGGGNSSVHSRPRSPQSFGNSSQNSGFRSPAYFESGVPPSSSYTSHGSPGSKLGGRYRTPSQNSAGNMSPVKGRYA